ncbi:MAG TPA: bifunctional phosphopantothenoylcysteine decarboxylase/phosphopantothenate--cysteine ligase CoaBC [Dehalococcoidia bacterium]|jgi:phosphopantothenoylcysteine decarboxylase/phosphopantothenate--cysteine ligase|nr:bifunctional phosphopantothenoylcysteine decarboxylase/phosphopantothenate--cysteine ligase CoaBC [Chloroflexota bacterium]MDP6273511.1 bifunctional phosphopantothenoylcysteine decarboxylase/phosphopantothenate--cysteine ligase CoaBC [Dehalococcoidia bacterium]MDP7160827.1 bifunctional phosphopantothenoylcysteine decarboxylase/phosphopantothenate--cysteine ligase CoaBC [Dehalococcoidia bacterium]MDP7514890.1 bifunctional phosphopantothenoylcysteine decarboxylase/phosphopantothenate--cysteine |tara:strand:- start:4013 stop:5212 length:1200 start_codon:yes stop_codon:yes gene_type:complete
MATILNGKSIVLGVTGSIAAFKAADLASKLTQAGALVDIVLTRSAGEFVGVATFAGLTHRPVSTGLFESNSELGIDHVALARRADLILIAPATANVLAKLAHGITDDVLTATVLARSQPLVVAPAMDADMYENPATQANVKTLISRGVHFIGPESGRLASGLVGNGRMTEVPEIIGHVRAILGRSGDLADRQVVVSAGGTEEAIDPVRVLTNRSTGKMGYAIAEAARDRGAKVTLITAPTYLPIPVGVNLVAVGSAIEMQKAVRNACLESDLLVMAAAVSDYRPSDPSDNKIKKTGDDGLSIDLSQNPDIIAGISGERLVKVAFAAETNDVIENADAKLLSKGVDMVVANDVSAADSGFGTDTNAVTFVRPGREPETMPLMDKFDVGNALLDRALPLLK